MKKVLILLLTLATLLVFQSGCQQQITHERHESSVIEKVESEEIVVGDDGKPAPESDSQKVGHRRTTTVEIIEESPEVIEPK